MSKQKTWNSIPEDKEKSWNSIPDVETAVLDQEHTEDPLNADYYLSRPNFTQAQQDSAYETTKQRGENVQPKNVLGTLKANTYSPSGYDRPPEITDTVIPASTTNIPFSSMLGDFKARNQAESKFTMDEALKQSNEEDVLGKIYNKQAEPTRESLTFATNKLDRLAQQLQPIQENLAKIGSQFEAAKKQNDLMTAEQLAQQYNQLITTVKPLIGQYEATKNLYDQSLEKLKSNQAKKLGVEVSPGYKSNPLLPLFEEKQIQKYSQAPSWLLGLQDLITTQIPEMGDFALGLGEQIVGKDQPSQLRKGIQEYVAGQKAERKEFAPQDPKLYDLGNAVGTGAMAYITGGAGSLAAKTLGLGTKGILATTAVTAGGQSFLMEGAGGYSAAKEYGLSDDEALGNGVIIGLVNAPMDVVPVIHAMKKFGIGVDAVKKEITQNIFKKGLLSKLEIISKDALEQGLASEGPQEALQEIMPLVREILYKRATDKPGAMEWWDRIGQSYFAGALVGGMFGGGGSVFEMARENSELHQVFKENLEKESQQSINTKNVSRGIRGKEEILPSTMSQEDIIENIPELKEENIIQPSISKTPGLEALVNTQIEEGRQNAERIRSDTGLLPEEGNISEESQINRGGNIQQPTSQQTTERLPGSERENAEEKQQISENLTVAQLNSSGENILAKIQETIKQKATEAGITNKEDLQDILDGTEIELTDNAEQNWNYKVDDVINEVIDYYKGKIKSLETKSDVNYTPAQYLGEVPTPEIIKLAAEKFGGVENLEKEFERTNLDELAESEKQKGILFETFARHYLADDALKNVDLSKTEQTTPTSETTPKTNETPIVESKPEEVPRDKRSLYINVLKNYGNFPLNSDQLGDYSNAKLPTTQVMKRLNDLNLLDDVKEFDKKINQIPNRDVQGRAENFELIARITLREAEKQPQPKPEAPTLKEGEGKQENIAATKPTNIEPTSPISEPENKLSERFDSILDVPLAEDAQKMSLGEFKEQNGFYFEEDTSKNYYKGSAEEFYNEVQKAKPPKETEFAETVNVPIKDIKTDEGRFQNRANAFSEETASSIEKNYNPVDFQPIVLWKDPKDGADYVLAGHSRLEGMKRRGVKEIPAKYYEGTEDEAINYARIESNRKATNEDLLADVKAYKRAKEQNYSKAKLLETFKKESKVKALDNFSNLDENGEFLRAINSDAAKSFPYIERNSSWVGELRKTYPQLTDAHERELFDYFYRGKEKNAFIKKEDLFNKVEDRVGDITFKPEQNLALDKLESTGSRARSDTRDITQKVDLLKARNRELATLSKGAPETQKNIFQKEILTNTEQIQKLESNIGEIINSQIDIFGQLEKAIKAEGIDEEVANEIITIGNPAELRKSAEDIESKAESNREVDLNEAVQKADEVVKPKNPSFLKPPKGSNAVIVKFKDGRQSKLPAKDLDVIGNDYSKVDNISFGNVDFNKSGGLKWDTFKETKNVKPDEQILKQEFLQDRSELQSLQDRKRQHEFAIEQMRNLREKGKGRFADVRDLVEPDYRTDYWEREQKEKQTEGELPPRLKDMISNYDFKISQAQKELKSINKQIDRLQRIRRGQEILPGQEDIFASDEIDIPEEFQNDFDFEDTPKKRDQLTLFQNVIEPKLLKGEKLSKLGMDQLVLQDGKVNSLFEQEIKKNQTPQERENPTLFSSNSQIEKREKEKLDWLNSLDAETKESILQTKLVTIAARQSLTRTFGNEAFGYNMKVLQDELDKALPVSKQFDNIEAITKEMMGKARIEGKWDNYKFNAFQKTPTEFQQHFKTKKVYDKMSPKEQQKFLDELAKGGVKEIFQANLSKEQAAAFTKLLHSAVVYDPRTSTFETALHESLHNSVIVLAKPFLAKNLLRENGWNGKGEIWDVNGNPSLKDAHEKLADKYVDWRTKQEENPIEPKTRIEKYFQALRELWAKIASYLNMIGLSTQAGYFYDLATGKLKKNVEKITDADIQTEVILAQSNFSKKIDDVLNGRTDQPITVTSTPNILLKLGAKQLPITISPSVIRKVLIDKHDLTPGLLKDLPRELHNPLMVFDSVKVPNSFVVMTELKSPKGNIVVAIHLNRAEQNHVVNMIASVYGKERDRSFIEWAEKGLLRYYDKNKSQTWLRSRGLQLPKEVAKSGSRKILTEDDFVNNKLQQKIIDKFPEIGQVLFQKLPPERIKESLEEKGREIFESGKTRYVDWVREMREKFGSDPDYKNIFVWLKKEKEYSRQEELFSKDLKYYLDRVDKISSIFEFNNWKKKHRAEIEDLSAFEQQEINDALVAQKRLIESNKNVSVGFRKRLESKGKEIWEGGITDIKKWRGEMIKEFGEDIAPRLSVIHNSILSEKLKKKEPQKDIEFKKDLTEKDYKEFYELQKKKNTLSGFLQQRAESAGKIFKSAKDLGRYLFRSVDATVEEISPKYFRKLIEHDQATEKLIIKRSKPLNNFLAGIKKFDKKDFSDLIYAMYNSDGVKLEQLFKKYNMEAAHKGLRKTLDEIGEASGLELTDWYFPRMLKDYAGFLKEFEGLEQRNIFDKLIENKEKKFGPLTNQQKALIIDNALRGYNRGITLGKLGNEKDRILKILEPVLASKYYYDPFTSLGRYITEMTQMQEARKFFGKLQSEDKRSIGEIINDEILNENLDYEQANKLKDALIGRFQSRPANKIISTTKKVVYIEKLGQVRSAVTQLKDLSMSLYRSGSLSTTKALYQIVSGNKKIGLEDIGVITDKIAQEISDPSQLNKILDEAMKYAGFTRFDILGKETFINSYFDRMKRAAKRNSSYLDSRLERLFTKDEIPQIKEDLRNGKISDNINLLLYSELSRTQPISKSALPLGYHNSPIGRIFYTLRTFAVRRLNFYMDEIVNEYKKDNKATAVKNALRLAVYCSIFGAGVDIINSILLGRKFDEDDLDDALLFNMMDASGINKYLIDKFGEEQFSDWIRRLTTTFPIPIVDNVYMDIKRLVEGKEFKGHIVKSIPIIGVPVYEWLLRGEVKNKKWKRIWIPDNEEDSLLEKSGLAESEEIKTINKKARDLKELRQKVLDGKIDNQKYLDAVDELKDMRDESDDYQQYLEFKREANQKQKETLGTD